MAKKQKHPEHENLERWLVSYADFITLLFATFVVLYALAQVDATDFAKLEESLKNAFSQNTLLDGQQALMDGICLLRLAIRPAAGKFIYSKLDARIHQP